MQIIQILMTIAHKHNQTIQTHENHTTTYANNANKFENHTQTYANNTTTYEHHTKS